MAESASTPKPVYAVRISDDDLYPRIKSGEYVIVSPAHACNPGDEVLVTTKEGKHRVWELLEQRDGLVTFASIKQSHGRISLDDSQILQMQYISAFVKPALYDHCFRVES